MDGEPPHTTEEACPIIPSSPTWRIISPSSLGHTRESGTTSSDTTSLDNQLPECDPAPSGSTNTTSPPPRNIHPASPETRQRLEDTIPPPLPNLGEATYSPVPSAHPLEAIGGPPSGGSSASSRTFHCPDIAPIPDQVADNTPASRLFFDRWAPKISATASIEELNEVTSLLTTDWHKLTSTEDEDRGKQNMKPRPPRPVVEDPSTKRRTQSRQQQRIKRQSNKARNSNASKLQRLFIWYPRRAVRKVLGDTGTVEAATEFLKGTYTCPRPSPDRIVGARQAYDQCEWARPSQEELTALSSPPSKEEISVKIKRATNTAPGADGIEYHDIAKLDPNGELLEVLETL